MTTLTVDYNLTQGDSGIIFTVILKDGNGNAVDLSPANSIDFTMGLPNATPVITGVGVPNPDQSTYKGYVSYTFTASDLLNPTDTYEAVFVVHFDHQDITFPGVPWRIAIEPRSAATWTYTASPFTSPATAQSLRDSVRFLIGDTDQRDPQLMDGEVDGLLSHNINSVYQAAIEACLVLQSVYARKATKSSGDLSIQWGTISASYAALRKSLLSQAERYDVPTPYAGGISKADMQVDKDNDDLVQPAFEVGGFDDENTAPDFGPVFSRVIPG